MNFLLEERGCRINDLRSLMRQPRFSASKEFYVVWHIISLFYLARCLILNLDVHLVQASFQAFEEVFDILRNDGSQ